MDEIFGNAYMNTWNSRKMHKRFWECIYRCWLHRSLFFYFILNFLFYF